MTKPTNLSEAIDQVERIREELLVLQRSLEEVEPDDGESSQSDSDQNST